MIANELQPYRIGAVSYLNTLPLVYGMLHGPQRLQSQLTFSLPSVCAEELKRGVITIGLVPVAEIARQELQVVPGVGIAARGPVRSILLFSKVPWALVNTIAVDTSSRTSVELARIVLREQYGATPQLVPHAPLLEPMLSAADAALIIGDPALRIEPAQQPYLWLDLAESWTELTGLPFVFAAWAGKPGIPAQALSALTRSSYQYGKEHIDEIVASEAEPRGIPEDLAQRYLRQHLHYELGSAETEGWNTFLSLAGLNRTAAKRPA